MAVNSKTELTVTTYRPPTSPALTDVKDLAAFFSLEFARLMTTIADLTDAAPQATDVAPKNPRNGMIRYAEGAWGTALGGNGLYVYKAGVWTHIV